MRFQTATLCFMFLILLACQLRNDTSTSEILWDVWKTSAPQYETSSMEIKKDWIIFKKGLDYFNANKITQIKEFSEGERALYEIHYKDGDSGEYIFPLYYFQIEDN